MPVDIKGKEYITVNERLLEFRAKYEDYSLVSEMLSNEGGVCIFRAIISSPGEGIVATGHAYEKEGSTFINKTSYIENCETSAWGRALANLGIGIDVSVASADEVGNAVKQQKEANPQPPEDHVEPSPKQQKEAYQLLLDAGEITAGTKQELTYNEKRKWKFWGLNQDQFQIRLDEANAHFAKAKK